MPDKPDQQSAGVGGEGPGALLRRARTARGLTLRDVAQDLHLDEWMLQALEEDDYSALGAPVFAKGHMRKYGSLLGLDTDDLMIAYYRKRGRDDSPPPITHMQQPQQQQRELPLPAIRWLIAALGIVLLVLLAWRFFAADPVAQGGIELPPAAPDQDGPAVPASESTATVPAAAALRADTDLALPVALPQQAAVGGLPEDDAADATEAPAEPPTPEAADLSAATTEVATVAPVSVRLSFSGDSWVEVTDSEGNRLLYDMMTEGRVRNVSGIPPIEVFLGRNRVVRLDVNGEFFAVPRRAIRGNTARFVIDPAAQ
ncbi:MAG: helix-turn-helix domain-containing protein [Gammaproteobacteria bacterium]|nr:helix-turn-helix domain-containing protein [Gammaproteobacteria bacterium]NNF61653.1 helix-turn-helix domain-containing protein [Gammaproteobacteria bacterium]NNM20541.1 helix-turn-helix domain-containing protein [Gammaproteobacteria bacterium]